MTSLLVGAQGKGMLSQRGLHGLMPYGGAMSIVGEKLAHKSGIPEGPTVGANRRPFRGKGGVTASW